MPIPPSARGPRPAARPLAVGLSAVTLALSCLQTASAAAAPPADCVPNAPGGPMVITPQCVDPLYSKPVIDRESDETSPVALHKVSGHFEGTSTRFTIYLPAKNSWQGRYFQWVYPLATENAEDRDVAAAAAAGAYFVQASGTAGYRYAAATAKFGETVATRYYRPGSRPIYGYAYGASGGSYETISGIENTTGVWDGAVPIVIGVPTSIPTNFFARALARLVLRDVAPRIARAVGPGGGGDPFEGLTPVQRSVLREVTALGLPPRAWEDPDYVLGLSTADRLLGFAATVRALDRTYADDFWTVPGYLGTEQSALGSLFRAALVDAKVTVTHVQRDAQGAIVSVTLGGLPPGSRGAEGLDYTLLQADGATPVGSLAGTLDGATGVLTLTSASSPAALAALVAGNTVRLDNRWDLALRAYHRYQVPDASLGLYAFDQFRGPDGTPLYPQRPIQIGPAIARSVTGGGTFTGQLNGKVIVVDNLLDADAYPWHADWYAGRVRAALGPKRFLDSFRVYYVDNADHVAPGGPARASRLIDYFGTIDQALRDVSAWVECGVAPPASTRYDVRSAQVTVPASAGARRGIQPVIDFPGQSVLRVRVGQKVTLNADVAVPPGTGAIVSVGWDPEGTGTFSREVLRSPSPQLRLRHTVTYDRPGTYIAGLKVASNRDGISGPFAQVENIGRVKIIVSP
jgi:hypothetical protein